jgi:ABC-type thiamine transport system ATPase subunit
MLITSYFKIFIIYNYYQYVLSFAVHPQNSREFRRTIIMVTHNPELAAATDRAIHIRDGAIEKEVVNIER